MISLIIKILKFIQFQSRRNESETPQTTLYQKRKHERNGEKEEKTNERAVSTMCHSNV